MSTPPSNMYKNSKYNINGNSTHNNIGLFTCTPKGDASKVNKDETIKRNNSFN